MNIEDICEVGRMVYSPYPEKTWNSNHLQIKFQRQHFHLSFFKILGVVPAGVWTRDLPRDSPMLNHLSHRCAVSIDIIVGFWKQYPSTCKWDHTQVTKKLASAPLKPLSGTVFTQVPAK